MSLDLIVETDIGRDPDDFFALCYLVSAGVNIRAITVSPGDKDQIAVVKFLCKELGLNIPVGAGDVNRSKSSVTGMHTTMLKKYSAPLRVEPDGDGERIIHDTAFEYTGCTVFAIGPLSSLGRFLQGSSNTVKHVFMQGGFAGYDIHTHPVQRRLEKFEGKTTVGTFNMGGDVKGALALLARKNLQRSFVGKNVCHTIEYDQKRHEQVLKNPPANRAMELFQQGMSLYLENHKVKLFHDPAAAVCLLHPEIGTWIEGEVYREGNGFGTRLPGKDQVLVDIDYEQPWRYIAEGK